MASSSSDGQQWRVGVVMLCPHVLARCLNGLSLQAHMKLLYVKIKVVTASVMYVRPCWKAMKESALSEQATQGRGKKR